MNKLAALLPFAIFPLLASGQGHDHPPVLEPRICKHVCPSHKGQPSGRPKVKAPAPGGDTLNDAIRSCAIHPDLDIGGFSISTTEERKKVEGGVELEVRVRASNEKAGVSWKKAIGFPKALEDSYMGLVVSDVHLDRVDVALNTWTVQFDVTLFVPDAK